MSTTTTPALHSTSFADMEWLHLLDKVVTFDGITLTHVAGSFGHVDAADAIAGRCPLVEATFTSDGRQAITWQWHTGDDSDGLVFVERWTTEGRVFHGWVHPESRRLVQAG